MTELERLDQLLAKQERAVSEAFRRYIELVQSDMVAGMIADRLERGDVRGAFAVIEPYVAQIGDVLPDIQREVGRETMEELRRIVPVTFAAISFDATHPRAAALVRTQRLGLIREFPESQFETVQQAVERAVGNGGGVVATARAFRDAIGLTAQQERAVWGFRRLLETGDKDALGRALRDRRYDADLRASITANQPLGPRMINTMVSRYRARALALRAETIARSEALRAYSEAREESLEQMVEQTEIAEDRVERIWNRVGDNRVRDWHDTMQGQTSPMGGTFVDGKGQLLRYPGDPEAPANTTISCRCTLTFRIKPAT